VKPRKRSWGEKSEGRKRGVCSFKLFYLRGEVGTRGGRVGIERPISQRLIVERESEKP